MFDKKTAGEIVVVIFMIRTIKIIYNKNKHMYNTLNTFVTNIKKIQLGTISPIPYLNTNTKPFFNILIKYLQKGI